MERKAQIYNTLTFSSSLRRSTLIVWSGGGGVFCDTLIWPEIQRLITSWTSRGVTTLGGSAALKIRWLIAIYNGRGVKWLPPSTLPPEEGVVENKDCKNAKVGKMNNRREKRESGSMLENETALFLRSVTRQDTLILSLYGRQVMILMRKLNHRHSKFTGRKYL